MIVLRPIEMEMLAGWYSMHNIFCHSQGDVVIEHKSGGGIGTVTVARCGCGNEINITDYESW